MAGANLLRPFSLNFPQHENRLTWAFLVALKYDPVLQNFFRELVESRLPPEGREHYNFWEPARISTQTKWIDSSTSRLVSVLLTDETIDESMAVEWSSRDAVYDGVIEYPNGLTLIVENKLSHDNVWLEQLSPSQSSISGNVDDVLLHDSAICLEWSEILEGVLKYADSGTAAFGSREMLRDLLSFVEEFHPSLTPYRTFRLCGNRYEALSRRAIRLLDRLGEQVELESRNDDYLFRPEKIAERVWIWVEKKLTLNVDIYPADTVSQARRFYQQVDRAAFLGLGQWEVRPNLHFSYMNTHLIFAETNWGTDRYFDYFAGGQFYGQMDQATLVPLAERWKTDGIITGEVRRKLEYQFNFTKRTTLNVIPGFSVCREWDLSAVIDLEEKGKLEEHVINALAAPLSTWEETL